MKKGKSEIGKAALDYATDELGRRVTIAGVIDRGHEAMALCHAEDGHDSFALVLRVAPTTQEWLVTDETDMEDYRRNVRQLGVGR